VAPEDKHSQKEDLSSSNSSSSEEDSDSSHSQSSAESEAQPAETPDAEKRAVKRRKTGMSSVNRFTHCKLALEPIIGAAVKTEEGTDTVEVLAKQLALAFHTDSPEKREAAVAGAVSAIRRLVDIVTSSKAKAPAGKLPEKVKRPVSESPVINDPVQVPRSGRRPKQGRYGYSWCMHSYAGVRGRRTRPC
jgi:hypothetical protein